MKIPLHRKELAFLDTETTGLNPFENEIIELGVIRGDNEYSWKFRPQRPEYIDPRALQVNGHSEKTWADAPCFQDVADDITGVLAGAIWVGHNISFDKYFLQEAYRRCDRQDAFQAMGHHALDTVTLAYEHLVPRGLSSLSLLNICLHLGISNQGAHTALADARRCKAVFEEIHRKNLTF